MLVVWEPILSSDLRPPGHAGLARISDPRARQFWDPDHLIAQEIAHGAALHPLPSPPACCFDRGFHWDEVLLYSASASWGSAPAPLLWGGPVYKSMDGLNAAIREAAPALSHP